MITQCFIHGDAMLLTYKSVEVKMNNAKSSGWIGACFKIIAYICQRIAVRSVAPKSIFDV